MKLKLKNRAYDILKEASERTCSCSNKSYYCNNCVLDMFDNEENSCSDNAKLLLKLLEGQK